MPIYTPESVKNLKTSQEATLMHDGLAYNAFQMNAMAVIAEIDGNKVQRMVKRSSSGSFPDQEQLKHLLLEQYLQGRASVIE